MESLLDAERTKRQKELLEHRRLCDVQMQTTSPPKLSRAPGEAQVAQSPALGLAEVQRAPVGDDGAVVAQERLQTRWTLMRKDQKDAQY